MEVKGSDVKAGVLSKGLSRVMWTAPLVTIGLFWAAFITERHTVELARQTVAGTRRPFILNGLTLLFDRHVNVPLTARNADSRYLVVVSSDTCPFSKEAVGPLNRLLGRVRFRPADLVVFVSTDGQELPNRLSAEARRRNISHTLITVTNKLGFVEESGIAWTPEFLVLDSNRRVRVASPDLNHKVETEIIGFFDDHVPTSISRR